MSPVTATAKEIEVFSQQAGASHKVVQLNVAGISQEESLIQPQPGGNCLNWVLGHLVCIYQNTLPLLGQKPVLEGAAIERSDRGSSPLEEPAEALDIQTL